MVIQNFFVETIQLADPESSTELVNLKSPLNTFLFILKRNIDFLFKSKRDLLVFQGVYSLHFILFDLFLLKRIKSIIMPRGDYIPHKDDIWAVPSRFRKILYWNVFIKRRILRANKLVFSSELELKRYQRMNVVLENIHIIPDSINLQTRFGIKNNNVWETKNSKLIMYVGRISPEKNIEFLLDVLSKLHQTEDNLKNYKLLIVGPVSKSKYSEFLLNKIEKMNLIENVIFKYSTNSTELSQLYQNCSVVLLPSHIESFGLTVLESLYFGKNIIVSDCTPWKGWNMELLHVCKLESNIWVDKILSLDLSSFNEEKSIQFLNMFSLENVSKKWEQLLNEI